MISIIDYGMGNLGSVKRELDRIGAASIVTSDANEVAGSDKIILPGVGHFSNAVTQIKRLGLWDILSEQVLLKKKPILGICLGMQLMSKRSEEGDCEGFGWFDAEVVRFNVSNPIKFKVPHMGWNSAVKSRDSVLLFDLEEDARYYFVHSYHFKCNIESDILTRTVYDYEFTSAVQKENIFGVQFHPEKSHDAGEKMLRNFVDI